MLWKNDVEPFDVSVQHNFVMCVVFMWIISDFSAYGILSRWSTHGRLVCTYCQDYTDVFKLKHGRKTSWFDCHRRVLPHDHPYHWSTTLFRKNKNNFEGPPTELSGNYMMTQLRDFEAERTVSCGGNWNYMVDGCGEYHNWHKKSIYWDLTYWKDHLLDHNLDIMHIEKKNSTTSLTLF